ncbi:NUDIX domain-containing protein [uncultured Alistipes sp.]|jgi:8-oxo-dGTP diphosphatase|uniref:NUDIX hydrolase n=1 Tax=uncultured Alistipes sp. TaxID=538949 RepID=UPI00272BEA2A|nr:NUDIX domain-containing protein [uncultured Alistipes sp.]
MSVQTNQSLSVDCAVFGFDGRSLKVLLIERRDYNPETHLDRMKLPGAMIQENETLPRAASRVLAEATGLREIYLKQMEIFSDPGRVTGEELEWINRYHGIRTERVVTVGYYALVKLDRRMIAYTAEKRAQWVEVESIQHLAMDHKQILSTALGHLCREMLQSPVAFELLPRKFTIRQLQNLYAAVLGIEIDNRNFRKKILGSGFLIPTDEREKGVSHKPARYYTFDKTAYKRALKEKLRLGFINNWRY